MTISLSRYLPLIASIAIGVIPVAVLIACFEVPRKIILGWGILSYVLGVAVLKLPTYHLFVVKVLHPRLGHKSLSSAQGIVSAVSELGSAALFMIFVVPDMSAAQLIGFGVAAAAVEAVVLPFIGNPFEGTPLGEHASNVLARSSNGRVIEWMGVLERALVFMPHISARGLIYVSIASGTVYPAIIGVGLFAAIDGVGYFGHLRRWDFAQVRTLTRFYVFLAIVGVVQSISFALLYARLL